MASQDSVLSRILNASIFNIYHCDETGTPDKKYNPNDDMYDPVAHAAAITLASMELEAIVLDFRELARQLGEELPDAWFLQGEGTIEEKTERKTRLFFDKYNYRFNTLFVDKSLKHMTCRAHHTRYEQNKDFDLREQPITLNGESCQKMVAAAKLVDPRRGQYYFRNQNYRDLLFTMSSCLLHEVSHVFVTYLTRGKDDTPTSIIAHVQGCWPKNGMGESGMMMEQRIFGGVVIPMQPVSAADHLKPCGIPYLVAETGTYRIKQETIDRHVECDFKFPYDTTDKDESETAKPMSDGQPFDPINHPTEHPDWPKLRDADPPIP